MIDIILMAIVAILLVVCVRYWLKCGAILKEYSKYIDKEGNKPQQEKQPKQPTRQS